MANENIKIASAARHGVVSREITWAMKEEKNRVTAIANVEGETP